MAATISVYDRMCWPPGELERALAGGAHRRELLAWFGPSEYRRLATLARAASAATAVAERGTRPVVYLIPGLLGTQLGWPRAEGQPCDLLWLDATDIAQGRLLQLRWRANGGARAPLQPLGMIPHTYLGLKLRLAAAGYRVVLYDYDWREDIDASAAGLARRLEAEQATRLVLIGHSMGGLVARAALGHCSPASALRIEQLIGLGAPHGGSIGAVQALRATYPVVLRLAALDPLHDAQTLSRQVFHSFVSLYQMLPRSVGNLDLSQVRNWPSTGLRPKRRLLTAAARLEARLPRADARFVSIIGTGRRTVTGLALHRGQFRYEVSEAGDGTVPAACATLPGARDYSLPCEHSELPRSPRVADALIELLQERRTAHLKAGSHARAGRRVQVSDAMLRRALAGKLEWQHLSASARRRYLNELNAPPAIYRATAVR
jgi:pimeloyl-ACP methyl ester carboxylesterase